MKSLRGAESIWEADSPSSSQEFPCILRESKVLYRVHKSPEERDNMSRKHW
jgi:hypothetical protein